MGLFLSQMFNAAKLFDAALFLNSLILLIMSIKRIDSPGNLTRTFALQQHLSISQPPDIGLVILASRHRHAVGGWVQTDAKHRAWTHKHCFGMIR